MSWRDQKESVLRGEANYDYIVGPGYYNVPTDVYSAGFATGQADRLQEDAQGADRDMSQTVPRDPQELYDPHLTNAGKGFHLMDHHLIALDLAPFQNNRKLTQLDQLATIFNGYHKLPLPEELPNGPQVIDTTVRDRDIGIGLGRVGKLNNNVPATPQLVSSHVNFSQNNGTTTLVVYAAGGLLALYLLWPRLR